MNYCWQYFTWDHYFFWNICKEKEKKKKMDMILMKNWKEKQLAYSVDSSSKKVLWGYFLFLITGPETLLIWIIWGWIYCPSSPYPHIYVCTYLYMHSCTHEFSVLTVVHICTCYFIQVTIASFGSVDFSF